MKLSILNALIGLSLATASAASFAGEWKSFPVKDAGYKPDFTLSLAGGSMSPSHVASGGYAGAELAFNCIALQPPTGVIRSKISVGEFNHNGMKLTTFEVNPRWTVNMNENLSFGIGPGIGLVKVQTAGQSTTLGALQLGMDLDYRIGALNLGLGARWQETSNRYITPTLRGANNSLVQAKIGINF